MLNQYTASSSRNAQLSQLDLVYVVLHFCWLTTNCLTMWCFALTSIVWSSLTGSDEVANPWLFICRTKTLSAEGFSSPLYYITNRCPQYRPWTGAKLTRCFRDIISASSDQCSVWTIFEHHLGINSSEQHLITMWISSEHFGAPFGHYIDGFHQIYRRCKFCV